MKRQTHQPQKLNPTLRYQTVVHELAHAWIAIQRGYDVTINMSIEDGSSGRITTGTEMEPVAYLSVLAAGFCGERVCGIQFEDAHNGARRDVEIILDCLGDEVGLELLNRMYQFFRDWAEEFQEFVEQHRVQLEQNRVLHLSAMETDAADSPC